jgi:ribA/ribD-fused uncharacterized protein
VNPILFFRGEYRFLSNFFPCEVFADWHYSDKVGSFRVSCPSVEHAYQAMKADKREDFEMICAPQSPGQAKRLGRTVRARPGWEADRVWRMEHLLQQKFARNSPLGKKLLATGDADLVEGNAWGDVYWGVCRGQGENHLGKILMKIRGDLKEG